MKKCDILFSILINLFLIVITTPLYAVAEQPIARIEAGRYTLSIMSKGAPHTAKCDINLIAEAQNFKKSITLRRPFYNCSLYGAVRITASDVSSEGNAFVFVEAARGGDGDHTGPIVEVFLISLKGFKKIGEAEIFDATYVREKGSISTITGKLLFDFCDVCDGPEASTKKLLVPVRLKIHHDKLIILTNLDEQGKIEIRNKFEGIKHSAIDEVGERRNYKVYVDKLEKRFTDLLAR